MTSMEGSMPSTVRSDISSSFKFIGDLTNPYEVHKKTPDIDSVLISLSKVELTFTNSLAVVKIHFHNLGTKKYSPQCNQTSGWR